MEKNEPWLAWAVELQALAQAGLHYGRDPFDRERYQRVREIAAEMIAEKSGIPPEKVRDLFCCETGYQTPKLDTRVVVHFRILLCSLRAAAGASAGAVFRLGFPLAGRAGAVVVVQKPLHIAPPLHGGFQLGIAEEHIGILEEPLQILEHLPGGLVAAVRVFGHGLDGDVLQALRDGGIQLPGAEGPGLDLLNGNADGGVGLKGEPPGEHLKEDDPGGVEVGPLVNNAFPPGLFRADVVHRADGPVIHGSGLGHRHLGDAEVHHLDAAVLFDHDVLGLDVPMDDAVVVGVAQGQHQLDAEGGSDVGAHHPHPLDVLLQGDAGDILHDNHRVAAIQKDIVDFDNIGVIQGIDGLGFVAEPPQGLGVPGVLIPEHFNGHGAVLGGIKAVVDIGHPPHPDEVFDEVTALQHFTHYIIHSRSPRTGW